GPHDAGPAHGARGGAAPAALPVRAPAEGHHAHPGARVDVHHGLPGADVRLDRDVRESEKEESAMRVSRRDALLSTLFGASCVGLRALATGLPAAFLLDPREAPAHTPGS